MNRIKLLRQQNKLKQAELAKIINVSQASLSGYENGKFEPDQKTLMNLATFFHVSTDYLLGNDDNVLSCSDHPTKIPLLYTEFDKTSKETGKSRCPLLSFNEWDGSQSAHGEYFGIQVQRDGMEPTILKNDIVIVRRQPEAKSGEIAVVQIHSYDMAIRRVMLLENGMILIADNPKYDPVFYTNEQIHRLPVIIIGKIVELRRKC